MTSLRRNTHIPKWTTVSIDGRLKSRRGCESGCYFSVTFDLVWFDLNATRRQHAFLVIDRVPAAADCQIHHVRIDFVQIIKPINGTDWILDRVTCELFTMIFHRTRCDEIRNWNIHLASNEKPLSLSVAIISSETDIRNSLFMMRTALPDRNRI